MAAADSTVTVLPEHPPSRDESSSSFTRSSSSSVVVVVVGGQASSSTTTTTTAAAAAGGGSGDSIHTLGRGGLGRINARYPPPERPSPPSPRRRQQTDPTSSVNDDDDDDAKEEEGGGSDFHSILSKFGGSKKNIIRTTSSNGSSAGTSCASSASAGDTKPAAAAAAASHRHHKSLLAAECRSLPIISSSSVSTNPCSEMDAPGIIGQATNAIAAIGNGNSIATDTTAEEEENIGGGGGRSSSANVVDSSRGGGGENNNDQNNSFHSIRSKFGVGNRNANQTTTLPRKNEGHRGSSGPFYASKSVIGGAKPAAAAGPRSLAAAAAAAAAAPTLPPDDTSPENDEKHADEKATTAPPSSPPAGKITRSIPSFLKTRPKSPEQRALKSISDLPNFAARSSPSAEPPPPPPPPPAEENADSSAAGGSPPLPLETNPTRSEDIIIGQVAIAVPAGGNGGGDTTARAAEDGIISGGGGGRRGESKHNNDQNNSFHSMRSKFGVGNRNANQTTTSPQQKREGTRGSTGTLFAPKSIGGAKPAAAGPRSFAAPTLPPNNTGPQHDATADENATTALSSPLPRKIRSIPSFLKAKTKSPEQPAPQSSNPSAKNETAQSPPAENADAADSPQLPETSPSADIVAHEEDDEAIAPTGNGGMSVRAEESIISGGRPSGNVGSQEVSKNNDQHSFNSTWSKYRGNGKNHTSQHNNIHGSFSATLSKFGGNRENQNSPQNEVRLRASGTSNASKSMSGSKSAAGSRSFAAPSLPQSNTSPENDSDEVEGEAALSSPPSKKKSIPSFLKARPKPSQQPAHRSRPVAASETSQSRTAENSNDRPLPSIKHQSMQSESKSRTYQQSKSQIRPQSKPQPRGSSKPPELRINPNDTNVAIASTSSKHNMVLPKSHQRLVLEQVAAQYFLRDGKRNARYVGATDYGDGDGIGLGNIDENFDCVDLRSWGVEGAPRGCSGSVCNVDRDAVLSFLGSNLPRSVDDEYVGANERANLSIVTEATSSTCDSKLSSAEQSAQDIVRETNIDCILEMASDHLSLGKNDLALQAYRRAMKVAFADVISVKNKLGVKKSQEGLDSITADLTREEEQHFELSLLKVASRVADIHNNMGVVHEMNRQYEKARSSYMDALEVYHNTCKRFEEKGDPDVDRTKKNVERMTLACNSEQQRRALHEKAMGIAKQLEREAHSDIRKNLLNEVVATLRRALDLESETIGLTHPVAAGTLIQIGKYHYEMREYDSAVLEIRQAITIYRNALGGNHPQVGKSTLLLASIFDRHGLHISPQGTCKDDSELELYVDALEPLKATLGEVHAEIGFLYAKIGYLYGKKGDLSLSLLAYKASLKSHGEPSSNKDNLEVMSIWVRITENLTGLKLWDEVLVAGRRALYLLRCSRNALFAMGSASASSSANTTSQPRGTTTKKSQIRITSDTYYTSLFSTLQSLGHAHTSLSNYALARDACSESLQLAWEMALSTSKAHSENEALAISVTRVIRALKRLGKAYLLEKHYAPALECFLPSLELLRSSKEMESTLDCASVLGSLGFLYLKLK